MQNLQCTFIAFDPFPFELFCETPLCHTHVSERSSRSLRAWEKNPLTFDDQRRCQMAAVERRRVWTFEACPGRGIRGQHSPPAVQQSSSELDTTWGFEAKGLMIKSVQEPAAAGDAYWRGQGVVVILYSQYLPSLRNGPLLTVTTNAPVFKRRDCSFRENND